MAMKSAHYADYRLHFAQLKAFVSVIRDVPEIERRTTASAAIGWIELDQFRTSPLRD